MNTNKEPPTPSRSQFRRLRSDVLETLERQNYIHSRSLHWAQLVVATTTAVLIGFVLGNIRSNDPGRLRDHLIEQLEAQASGQRDGDTAILAHEIEVRPVGDSIQMVLDLGVRVEFVRDPSSEVAQEVLRQSLATSTSPTARRSAVALIASYGSNLRSLEAAARTDTDELVRSEALAALVDNGGPQFAGFLEERLSLDPSLRVRWLAFEALFGAEAAADPKQRAKLRMEVPEGGRSL